MIEQKVIRAGKTEVVHLGLAPARGGDVVALAALAHGDQSARVFFNAATQPKKLIATPEFGLAQVASLRGNAGIHADGTVDAEAEDVSIGYEDKILTLPLSHPRTDLLAGQDCLLSFVNQALSKKANKHDDAQNPTGDPAYVCNWLAHHAAHQGVTAALLINRLGPKDAGTNFAKQLASAAKKQPTGLERIVVLDLPGPTGRPDQGDERHLIYAPEAPGKSRMEVPANDPWRSTFGDEVLLEFLRIAFFSRAAGVAFLDTSDFLSPSKDGATVYDAARAARPDPLITLVGQRAFAWKLPNHGRASVGDHICRPFDMKAEFLRWVFSPVQARNAPHVWRPHRIIGLSAQAAPEQKLWRFTGLRYPGAASAQLVPKSSLRENADLLALSRDVFDYDPFRVPNPEIEIATGAASDRGDKIVLVTAMKNEGPFLLEWIAYHRAIGVTNFIVFTNDCTDGTDTFLDLLAKRGIVEHYPNPFREMNLKPQHAGFRAAEKLDTVKNADWLMTLDVDEFINVHVGDGHLRDLFAAVGQANMISCTWRLFGNGDISGYEDAFLLDQFTRCAAKSASRPHQAWGFKTLYQNNGIFRKLGVHRPKGLHGAAVEHLKWVNGSGAAMPKKEFRSGWRSNTSTIGYDLVSLNHYAVRSTESFLVKRDRGRVNHVDRDQGEAYWFRMNHNTTEDKSIQRMIPALQAEWAELMVDSDIAAAHAHSVQCHRDKIAVLMARPEPRAFYETLNSSRTQTLSRLLPAFGSGVFLAGPQCVPQDIVDRFAKSPMPKDFFFTVDPPVDAQH
ncbi:MAG: glycosyltransferase family 2 protein [Paracoccaceae bacterium]